MLKTMDPVQRARRGIALFVAVLLAASALIETTIVRHGYTPANVYLMTWTPCFASIIARVVLREGIEDVSFRLSRAGARLLTVGWIYPMAVLTLAYGVAWSTGLCGFSPGIENELGLQFPGNTPAARMGVIALFSLTAGVVINATMALGEEMGWRGYLLTRLIAARVPQPALVTGLLWGGWHIPLILSGRYMAGTPHPGLSCVLFIVTTISLSYLATHLRLQSGSIWPPVALHAAWNSLITFCFDGSTQGPSAWLWLGEGGLLVASATALLAAVFVRAGVPVQGPPSEKAPAPLGAARPS